MTVLKNLRMVDEGAMAVAASATPDELHTDMLAQVCAQLHACADMGGGMARVHEPAGCSMLPACAA